MTSGKLPNRRSKRGCAKIILLHCIRQNVAVLVAVDTKKSVLLVYESVSLHQKRRERARLELLTRQIQEEKERQQQEVQILVHSSSLRPLAHSLVATLDNFRGCLSKWLI